MNTLNTRIPLISLVLALLVVWSDFPLKGLAQPAAAQEKGRLEIPALNDGLPGQGPIRRYDWFQNLWNERRSRWAKRVERDQKAVVFLGDSITQGWGEDFSAWFPGMKTANRGISGDTSRGVLIRLQEDVLALNPSAIVLLIGTNDLEEGADPEWVASNVKLILQRIHEHNPSVPVILCEVFPSSASKSRGSDQIKRINQLLAQAVKGNQQITSLETWKLFANEAGDAKPEEFPDLLHPNLAGYAKWAAAMRPVFATLGFLETDPYEYDLEPGYSSLFNGTDLTGWEFRPSSPSDIETARNWQARDPNAPPWPIVTEREAFADKAQSSDGRYVAKKGRLIVTTPTEGRKIQQLWTTRDFPNDFTLRLEFRATPNADSGVFIRGRQLQCRDYPLAGPYSNLKNYRPGDWNELEVIVRGNLAYCLCNGELLEAKMEIPATGPIGLEGDRGQLEYRRIRIATH